MIEDLLGQLQGNTRRGAGCEVDKHPTPSTRGTAESSEVGGHQQGGMTDREWAERVDLARARCASGDYTGDDVLIVRERTRVPWTLTNGEPCDDDCPHVGRRRHFMGVEIGDSVCDVDGTCWTAESAAHTRFRAEHGRSATVADANYRRGVVVLRVVETIVANETPIEKLARGKVGQPPKMSEQQIREALSEIRGGSITVGALARRDWERWGFKTERSAEAALRRYRSLRAAQEHNHDHQEVAA